jgi:hypothetical protein
MGQANGITMIVGCELSIARWVRNPVRHRVAEIRAAQHSISKRKVNVAICVRDGLAAKLARQKARSL